jgi:phosphoribosylformylglycinamidine synthase
MTGVVTGGKPRFAVIRFPGSNCDQDSYFVIRDVLGCPVEYVWHADTSLTGFDAVVLPGGFSYGDYLRTGAVARFARIMDAVRAHADQGKPVLGICNGFQILCEAHLLPGALVMNDSCKFRCRWTTLRTERADTIFTRACRPGQLLRIPIAHGEGRFSCDAETLSSLEANGQVIFRYADESGNATPESNPNGSLDNIAGIMNAQGNVLGMMPHPERAAEGLLGSDDGRLIFESIVRSSVLAHA